MTDPNFVDAVNHRLEELGMDRAALAAKMNVHQSFLNDYLGSENGKTLPKRGAGPGVEKRFCEALGIAKQYIVVKNLVGAS